jgi:hypothetical protein
MEAAWAVPWQATIKASSKIRHEKRGILDRNTFLDFMEIFSLVDRVLTWLVYSP